MPAVSQKVKPINVTLAFDVIQKIKEVSRLEDRSFSNALCQLVRRAAIGRIEEQELVSSR